MITLRLDAVDLVRLRFAISPLGETVGAVRALLDPRRRGLHQGWLPGAQEALERLDLGPLPLLLPPRGYVPDFLAPPPTVPVADLDDEVARARATPVEQVVTELTWAFEGRPTTPAMERLLDAPDGLAAALADVLQACWHEVLAPVWPRVRDLLDGDVLHRTHLLANGGLERLLADLHPDVRLSGDRVEIGHRYEDTRDLEGLGLVLSPSVFMWPDVAVSFDRPWQPTLIYPARGVGRLWEQSWAQPTVDRGPALAALVGRTRARLLSDLVTPASTSQLAGRYGLAVGTVSEHLTALRDAGLLTAHRAGRQVLYEVTPLGAALLGTSGGG